MKDEEVRFDSKVFPNGTITIPWQSRERMVALYAAEEIVVEVVVKRKRKKRTLNQNAYYHAVVVEAFKDALNDQGESFSADEAHVILRGMFLKETKYNAATNTSYDYMRSTTSLKTHEFAVYVDKCIQLCAEWFGVVVPPPHQMTDRYTFPQFQGLGESRSKYVERITEHVSEIFDVDSLKRYYAQNKEWLKDAEINAVFNDRHREIVRQIKT